VTVLPEQVAMFVEVVDKDGADFDFRQYPPNTVFDCEALGVTCDIDPITTQIRVAQRLRVVHTRKPGDPPVTA
jgi:hypothetical protein